jgi:hypothetical protein
MFKMDIQNQDPELNGAHLVSSLKDLCVHIKYEEHADTAAFPLIVCYNQVIYVRVSFLFLGSRCCVVCTLFIYLFKRSESDEILGYRKCQQITRVNVLHNTRYIGVQ